MTSFRRLLLGVVLSLLAGLLGCSKDEAREGGTIIINEFLASNKTGLRDEDGDRRDWLELKNTGSQTVSLDGWSLTDDTTNPEKWVFPAIDIAPQSFVVVFASGKNRKGTTLHANFKLSSSGDYLALFAENDKANPVSEWKEKYPAQVADIAYGTHMEPGFHYLAPPTPGAENTASEIIDPFASSLSVSHPAGLFFDDIELTVQAEGALYYTLDGTMPSVDSTPVSGAIPLSKTTQLRVFCVPSAGGESFVETLMFVRASEDLRNRQSHLPLVVVDAFENGAIDDEGRPRTYYPAALVVVEPDETSALSTLGSAPTFVGRSGIHIRGNSTASYDKKQYSLETWDESDQDKDVSLLGFPVDSDWVLHAPFADKTLMRNHLMYQWSRAMGRYAARTQFIELYLNKDNQTVSAEDYVGVYVFMEKVKRGADRVNVESLSSQATSEPEISGGYLLEKGWNFSEDIGIRTSTYEDELQFIYPKPEAVNSAQRNYLQGFFDAFEESLSSSRFDDPETGYAQYIDVDSFIDHHLMVEFARNIDGYVLSTFMHKNRDGLLNMGPIWDYNGALGNPDYFEGDRVDGWHFNNPEFPADNPNAYHWYSRLFEDSAFRQRYAARWRELRGGVFQDESMMADIEAVVEILGDAGERNFERWSILGDYVWPNAPGWDERDTFRKEVNYMKQWIRDRAAWMDSELGTTP